MSNDYERTTTTSDPNLIQPLYRNGVYKNPWSTWEERTFSDVIKWKWNSPKIKRLSQKQLDEIIPIQNPPNMELIHANDKNGTGLKHTWIGHATSLVQMEGEDASGQINFLTDPVWSHRCSPVQFAGPARIRKTPFSIDELPPIHFVILSHDHYDHLDYHTMLRLADHNAERHPGSPATVFVVPIGMKKWFTDTAKISSDRVFELSWWQSYRYNDNLEIVCTPCQHWSKRTAFDQCRALWSSWAVIGKNNRVWFSGDTGYCEVFKSIGQQYGPFDLSMIAVGAYCPRDFMKPQHVDPEEAVMVHKDIQSKFSVGIHWGTFILTDEPEDEPPQKLAEEVVKQNLRPEDFIVTKIGETKHVVKSNSNNNE
mmetsp:Transcript_25475/g.35745  ORF Transcript_25475/g.35745 Transcript_25475/m.35745 type:complete len:368 (+) Transcript_25475:110-1213(+)